MLIQHSMSHCGRNYFSLLKNWVIHRVHTENTFPKLDMKALIFEALLMLCINVITVLKYFQRINYISPFRIAVLKLKLINACMLTNDTIKRKQTSKVSQTCRQQQFTKACEMHICVLKLKEMEGGFWHVNESKFEKWILTKKWTEIDHKYA